MKQIIGQRVKKIKEETHHNPFSEGLYIGLLIALGCFIIGLTIGEPNEEITYKEVCKETIYEKELCEVTHHYVILDEIEKCKEWGGTFNISGYFLSDTGISCEKTVLNGEWSKREVLFKYNLGFNRNPYNIFNE